jgi:hypothetical protein
MRKIALFAAVVAFIAAPGLAFASGIVVVGGSAHAMSIGGAFNNNYAQGGGAMAFVPKNVKSVDVYGGDASATSLGGKFNSNYAVGGNAIAVVY